MDARLADELESGSYERFIERWRAQPLFAADPPRVRELAMADQRRNDPHALAAVLRGIGTGEMEPLWPRLGELEMPVTVIAGERDSAYREIARRMSRLLPAGELRVLAGRPRAGAREPRGARRGDRCRPAARAIFDGALSAGRSRGAGGPRPASYTGSTPRPLPAGRAIAPPRTGRGSARSANRPSVASPQGASGPREASAAAACSAAATPIGPSSVEARYTSAPVARTSVAAASRPAIPPQRETFRHTASATPEDERARLGGGLVDRHAHRGALAHLAHAGETVGRLLDELEARGRERRDRRHRLVGAPCAVRVEPKRDRGAGGRAHRGHASGVVADADLQLDAAEALARGAPRLIGCARAVERGERRVDGHPGCGSCR